MNLGLWPIRITIHPALATYLGAAVIAAYVILRAWDHLHGRPIEPDPWAALPQPDCRPCAAERQAIRRAILRAKAYREDTDAD